MKNETKNKHMSFDDRIEIQECLSKGMTFKAIALRIDKSPTTVSREVKRNSQSHSNVYTRTQEPCPLLIKAPFVCNGCSKRSRSTCSKKYEQTLCESRSGIPLSKESFYQTEKIISDAVRKGQHICHANGKSSYDMFAFAYSVKLAETPGISHIPSAEVIQSLLLLKKHKAFSK